MTMLVPRMSAGIRSGVNWMRLKLMSSTSPSVRTSSVLPRPGTPSSSTCPPPKMAMSVPSTMAFVADDDFADFRAERFVAVAERLDLFFRIHNLVVAAGLQ